ncbi:restriction endonuclease subunit S [Cyclobacterium xiamenense]|uniref:restriction endonuclease subunit S n=1 Tax=Cyclobacterium xiamenense TaxID=1297121 RepID=UPI0035D0283C
MKTQLGNHINLYGGGTPSKEVESYWNGEIPWASVKDLKEENFIFPTDRITEAGVKNSATRIVPKGSLIIATRMAVGKVAFASDDMAINQDLKVIEPQKELDRKYLFYFLKANDAYFQGVSSGATVKGIKIKHINSLELTLPPLSTQKKIAAILDAADAHRQKTRQLLAKYDALAQSIFLEMFGDPVTNPKGWEIVKFSEVGKLDRGKSKHRPRNATELLGGIHPLIQTGDVANSGGYIKNYTSTYSDLGLRQSKMWPKGTLCITIAANIAKTGILKFDACFPDSVVGFIPNKKTNNEYVQGWMKFLQKIIEDSAPESAQKNINLKILRDLDFMVPRIEFQKKYSAAINSIECQKDIILSELEESESLFNSLLQKAFKGELVK